MVHLDCGGVASSRHRDERAGTVAGETEYTGLCRLADVAVSAGTLPGDPDIPMLIIEDRPDAMCSLCAEPLGRESVFELRGEQTGLLHALCFSAWVDVVVTPTR